MYDLTVNLNCLKVKNQETNQDILSVLNEMHDSHFRMLKKNNVGVKNPNSQML